MAVIYATRTHREGVGGMAKVRYKFSQHGGVVGANLLPFKLPAGAILHGRGLIQTIVQPTSGGSATLALTMESSGDLLGATAKASFTGNLDLTITGAASTAIVLTAERQLTLTVATAALTAGEFIVWIPYLLP